MFDVAAIRRLFPIFDQTLPKGLPVTYLDSAASNSGRHRRSNASSAHRPASLLQQRRRCVKA